MSKKDSDPVSVLRDLVERIITNSSSIGSVETVCTEIDPRKSRIDIKLFFGDGDGSASLDALRRVEEIGNLYGHPEVRNVSLAVVSPPLGGDTFMHIQCHLRMIMDRGEKQWTNYL